MMIRDCGLLFGPPCILCVFQSLIAAVKSKLLSAITRWDYAKYCPGWKITPSCRCAGYV